MTIARRKGDAGRADFLFSRIIRARGRCERCGDHQGPFDTAHIVRRRYSATRCVEDNAWCLCRGCHRLVDEWGHVHQGLVRQTIGIDRYLELVGLAMAGPPLRGPVFWKAEVERLEETCRERGIDMRRKIA